LPEQGDYETAVVTSYAFPIQMSNKATIPVKRHLEKSAFFTFCFEKLMEKISWQSIFTK